MAAFARRFSGLVRLAMHGELDAATSRVRSALWSDTISVRLERDLGVPFAAPPAAIPISIRPLQDSDVAPLLGLRTSGITSSERVDRERRARLVRASLPTAYVAVTDDADPCYVQWLIGPAQNDRILDLWSGEFPPLAAGEALLEGAFTPEAFRGRRIMPAAMARIADLAADVGATCVVTYVTYDNVASLKGCARAGFVPVSARRIRRRIFRTLIDPVAVPKDIRPHFGGPTTTTAPSAIEGGFLAGGG